MTFVKICGLSQPEHVITAVNAGASMIGFVFAPSKREVTLKAAQELAKHIPSHIKKVGVFVNSDADTIKTIYNAVPLDYVQYHGDESNEFIQQIGLPSIKAFAIRTIDDITKAKSYNVDYYLFDTPGTAYRGGSGHTFDWSLLAQADIPMEKTIVAGGLNETNVTYMVDLLHPSGVDVSSGVELNGTKNNDLIERFITTVKGAIV
ncbi:MAG: phosphoribosylanthranilate isomerase [Lysinibacillus sp.]